MQVVKAATPASGAHDTDDANMFDLAPVSLWVEDYSGVKILFEEWRNAGVTSLRDYLCENPERVKVCASLIRVVKVNRKTLSLFEAPDMIRLVANLATVFRD